MKNVFITYGLNRQWASYRWRAEWPSMYMRDTNLIKIEDAVQYINDFPIDYDNYIFVKVTEDNLIKRIREAGKKIWVDYCDPGWWFNPQDARKQLDYADGMVCSCQPLADDLERWSGHVAHCIPDRVYLPHYKIRKEHYPHRHVRLIWYGAYQNRISIFASAANLMRAKANGYDFDLTIFDDRPDMPWQWGDMKIPIYYALWELEKENEVIAAHDIALLPPYPGPWGKVKSNNKTLTAWACGLPTTDGQDYEDLCDLIAQAAIRRERADFGYAELLKYYDVVESSREWEEILCAS